MLLRSLRPSLEESSRSRCSPPAPPLARDAIACSALEERAVYFISLSRRTLSTVLSSSSGERKWHPYAENVRPARVRQQLCPGVGLECQKKNYLPPSAFRRQPLRLIALGADTSASVDEVIHSCSLVELLQCVLYVRSRATFSIRHPLGAHSVIVRNLSGMCLFFRTLATAKIRTRDDDCQLFATFRMRKTLRQPEWPVGK